MEKVRKGEKVNNYTTLKIKKETAQRFMHIAQESGIEYSKFLERLMDDSPFSNYLDSLVKHHEKRKENGNSDHQMGGW